MYMRKMAFIILKSFIIFLFLDVCKKIMFFYPLISFSTGRTRNIFSYTSNIIRAMTDIGRIQKNCLLTSCFAGYYIQKHVLFSVYEKKLFLRPVIYKKQGRQFLKICYSPIWLSSRVDFESKRDVARQ